MRSGKKFCALFLSCLLIELAIPTRAQDAEPAWARRTPEELHQLAAPIALYPDALVAQVLAASTHPTEIVEANDWLQQHSKWQGNPSKLAKEVNKQHWDPSVKALAQFPSVLQNMDKNLAWTSSLGEAFTYQPNDVNDAVQFMRQQAQKAGKLSSTPQQTVTTQGQTIVIQPATPNVVYVPAYDPWVVYGYPVAPYPGWVPWPGVWYGGPTVVFGPGYGIGPWGGYGWGWNHWGYSWPSETIIYNNNTYFPDSRTFNNYALSGNGYAPNNRFQPSSPGTHFGGGGFSPGLHGGSFGPNSGFTPSSQWGGMSSGAFSGFGHGGDIGGFSARGQSSFGGFGGFRR